VMTSQLHKMTSFFLFWPVFDGVLNKTKTCGPSSILSSKFNYTKLAIFVQNYENFRQFGKSTSIRTAENRSEKF